MFNFKEDDYLKKLQEQKDELYKINKQVSDQRREYRKLLTYDSRADHLTEKLLESADNLTQEIPLVMTDYIPDRNRSRHALLFFADWHYGMVTDNIWNKYNVEICKQRVMETVKKTIEYLKLFKIDELSICLLGDAANGCIHVTSRVASEEYACDQLMHVSELIAESIEVLSYHVNKINVYSCYGNHLRSIQNHKYSIYHDNLEKIIPWWVRERLKNNKKVTVIDSEFKEFVKIRVFDSNIVCIHGDLDNIKDVGVTVNTLFTKLYGETIDYVVSAHGHHLEEFEQFNIETIMVRCLCGTDDYANSKRLYSMPGQSLVIFNQDEGRECTRNIKFTV